MTYNPLIAILSNLTSKLLSFVGLRGIGRRNVAYANTLNSKLMVGSAVVIPGGTSLSGGKSGMLNTLIGVLIWTFLGIGLDLYD